jgi:hypothetical protein
VLAVENPAAVDFLIVVEDLVVAVYQRIVKTLVVAINKQFVAELTAANTADQIMHVGVARSQSVEKEFGSVNKALENVLTMKDVSAAGVVIAIE